MKRLRAVFTRPFPRSLEVLPGGIYLVATFYLLTGACLNAMLVYSAISGKILHRWDLEWHEARRSAPVLYWVYFVGLGIVVLFLDGYFLYGMRRLLREKKA